MSHELLEFQANPQNACEQPAPIASVPLHVWCDASCDSGLAFGAFMHRGMDWPRVVRLRSSRSEDAELEIVMVAARSTPVGSVIYTDLEQIDCILERWNYWLVRELKDQLEKTKNRVLFVQQERRHGMYRLCHRAALKSLRKLRERKKR